MMSIDANLLIAAKIVHDECAKNVDKSFDTCCGCRLRKICGTANTPDEWNIPNQLPEPTERPRIEWLRMLPDNEMLNVMDYSHFSLECADCYNSDSEGECLRKSDVEYCDVGHMEWWREVVTLEQFRKDVGLSNDTDS